MTKINEVGWGGRGGGGGGATEEPKGLLAPSPTESNSSYYSNLEVKTQYLRPCSTSFHLFNFRKTGD